MDAIRNPLFPDPITVHENQLVMYALYLQLFEHAINGKKYEECVTDIYSFIDKIII